MTTFVFDATLGPIQDGSIYSSDQFISNYPLDDSNDAFGWSFCIPKTGTITDVGFLAYQLSGTPPEYKAGITTITTVSGWPTQTPYGSSAIKAFTPTVSGWTWITLDTPASAILGEYAAVHVFPSTVAPTVANNLKVARNTIHLGYGPFGFPKLNQFTTTWANLDWGYGYFAIKYDTNDIYGYPIRTPLSIPISSTTSPDEIGCKFTLPFDVNCTGPSIVIYTANMDANISIILYDSNDTVLGSINFSDLDIIKSNNTDILKTDLKWSSPVTLTKDTVYRVVIKPNSSTSLNVCGLRFDTANDKDNNMFNHLSRWDRTQRTDGGSWTDIDTDVMSLGIIIDSISVDTGAAPAASTGGSYAYVG